MSRMESINGENKAFTPVRSSKKWRRRRSHRLDKFQSDESVKRMDKLRLSHLMIGGLKDKRRSIRIKCCIPCDEGKKWKMNQRYITMIFAIDDSDPIPLSKPILNRRINPKTDDFQWSAIANNITTLMNLTHPLRMQFKIIDLRNNAIIAIAHDWYIDALWLPILHWTFRDICHQFNIDEMPSNLINLIIVDFASFNHRSIQRWKSIIADCNYPNNAKPETLTDLRYRSQRRPIKNESEIYLSNTDWRKQTTVANQKRKQSRPNKLVKQFYGPNRDNRPFIDNWGYDFIEFDSCNDWSPEWWSENDDRYDYFDHIHSCGLCRYASMEKQLQRASVVKYHLHPIGRQECCPYLADDIANPEIVERVLKKNLIRLCSKLTTKKEWRFSVKCKKDGRWYDKRYYCNIDLPA